MSRSERYRRVHEAYRGLEPAGVDTWNPLGKDRELLHRLVL